MDDLAPLDLVNNVFAPALEIVEKLRPAQAVTVPSEVASFYDNSARDCWRMVGRHVDTIDLTAPASDLEKALACIQSLRRDTQSQCNTFGDVGLFLAQRIEQLEKAAQKGWAAAKNGGNIPEALTIPDENISADAEPCCIQCGKPMAKYDWDRSTCHNCRDPKGKLFDLDVAIRASGDDPQRIEQWPEIRHLLRKRFGDNHLDVKLWERFTGWLLAERKTESSDYLRISLDEVVALLADDTAFAFGSQPVENENYRSQTCSTPAAMPTKKTPIYISYAWGDDRETGPSREDIVDRLYQSLLDDGYDVRRDKKDLKYRDRIDEFMKQIVRSECIIVVISDKYLRSRNCMFELFEIHNNSEFQERICPIVLSDAKVHDPTSLLEYVKFWVNEASELDGSIERLGHGNLSSGGTLLEAEKIRGISQKADEILSFVSKMNSLSPALIEDNDFETLKRAIDERLDQIK